MSFTGRPVGRPRISRSRQKKTAGLWTSPLRAQDLAAELRFSDVLWDNQEETLVWREERSDQGVLVCQSQEDPWPRDLTAELSVRARVGYGGGDFTVSHGFVYFVSGGRLYQQLLSGGEAQPITPEGGECSAPSVSPDGKDVIYLHSAEGTDVLALVDARGKNQPVVLSKGHDFYMHPCWHPQGSDVGYSNGTGIYSGN